MHATIKKLYEEEGKSRKLFIAGHSLGAALATVASACLAFVDDMHIAGIYTIGSPRYCSVTERRVVRHNYYNFVVRHNYRRILVVLRNYSKSSKDSRHVSACSCFHTLLQRYQ